MKEDGYLKGERERATREIGYLTYWAVLLALTGWLGYRVIHPKPPVVVAPSVSTTPITGH